MSSDIPMDFYDPRTDFPGFEPMDHFNNYRDMCTLIVFTDKAIAKSKDKPIRFLEVGTWAGQVPVMLKARFLDDIYITVVDNWEGTTGDRLEKKVRSMDAYHTFVRNCGLVKENWLPHVLWGQSIEEAKEIKSAANKYDIIFIDANHEYKDVLADIKAWHPLVAPGGILCGHDYPYFGVTQAVNEVFGGKHKVCGNIWWVEV